MPTPPCALSLTPAVLSSSQRSFEARRVFFSTRSHEEPTRRTTDLASPSIGPKQTATATPRVAEDILAALRLEEPLVLRAGIPHPPGMCISWDDEGNKAI